MASVHVVGAAEFESVSSASGHDLLERAREGGCKTSRLQERVRELKMPSVTTVPTCDFASIVQPLTA
jgi:hypothetical protein